MHSVRVARCFSDNGGVNCLVSGHPIDVDRHCHSIAGVCRTATVTDGIRGASVDDASDVPRTSAVKNVLKADRVHFVVLGKHGGLPQRPVLCKALAVEGIHGRVACPAKPHGVHFRSGGGEGIVGDQRIIDLLEHRCVVRKGARRAWHVLEEEHLPALARRVDIARSDLRAIGGA